MKRFHWGRVAWACLVWAEVAVLGQTPSTLPPQPALRVTTRLVEVSVVAQDKKGQPIAGLTRDDFTLLDEGRPQPISVFSVELNQPLATSPELLPPNTFSNRLEKGIGISRSATAILFDGLNTRVTDQAYARQQIIKFLEQLEPQDRVALYALGRGLRVLQDFTDTPGLLLSALSTYKGELTPELDLSLSEDADTSLRQFHTWLDELRLNLIDYYARDRALRTIRSLVAIANHVERLPGRKNLIWVSGSFPFWVGHGAVPLPERLAGKQQSFAPEIERAARALNNANLAIYPVDARGLMAPPDFSPERASIGREPLATERATFDTMQVLADRTGGRAFFNTNDIRGALRRALEDSGMTYVLGYYPTHGRWNGKFREIKVEVRRPGVALHFRRGYFAQPDEPSDPWYRQAVLDAAMWSPVDATRLGLTVRVAVPASDALDLEFQLDPKDITLQARDGRWEGTLDLLLVQLAPGDRHLKSTSHIANLRLNRETYERAMRDNVLALTERLELAPGASLLRVLARDIPSGALGSVSIPLSRVLSRRGG